MTTDEMIETMARAAYAKVSETSVDSPHVKYVFACRETDYGEDADTWYYAQGFRSAQRAALAAILPVLREDIGNACLGDGNFKRNNRGFACADIFARFDEIAKEVAG